jgi:hypothetical protein
MSQIQWVTVPKLKGFLGKVSDHFRVADHSPAISSSPAPVLPWQEQDEGC